MYNKPQGITLFYVVIIEKNGGLFNLLTVEEIFENSKRMIIFASEKVKPRNNKSSKQRITIKEETDSTDNHQGVVAGTRCRTLKRDKRQTIIISTEIARRFPFEVFLIT